MTGAGLNKHSSLAALIQRNAGIKKASIVTTNTETQRHRERGNVHREDVTDE